MKNRFTLLFLLSAALHCIAFSTLEAQTISYTIPDIGTPGMNTYIEIIGPHSSDNNFGSDGVYLNNIGNAMRVACVNASDTNKVKFGPFVVSWNGKMISTQVFVLPGVSVSSSDWRSGVKIPFRFTNGTLASNIDTFFIVQPQHFGTMSTSGVIGSGGAWGTRSKRGAMIVDSMILNGTGTYTIDTSDCDPNTTANQGFLPAVIITKGHISLASTAILSLDGNGIDGGPGGGGGGSGRVCGTTGGNGYTGGGGNGTYNDGCGDFPAGTGTGSNQDALNGASGGQNTITDEGGGGGTGLPFGVGGGPGGAASWNGGAPGSGGGTGGPQCCEPPKQGGGGGGAFATAGTDGGVWEGYYSGGYKNGNSELVPMSAGSGGGGGNVNSSTAPDNVGAGGGGGAGGGLALYSRKMDILGGVTANAAAGLNSSVTGAGGGGSGGGIICGSKINLNVVTAAVSGGAGGTGYPSSSGQDGGDGGAGRVRLDGPSSSTATVTPSTASQYTGPSTDTTSWVSGRSLTLTGTGNGNKIRLYLRSERTPWQLVDSTTATSWSRTIALPNSPCDSLFFIVAAQQVPTPSTATYTAEPSWVLSQAAGNIIHAGTPVYPTISANGPVSFCDSGRVMLTPNRSYPHYVWSTSDTTQNLVVRKSGTYYVDGSDDKYCWVRSDSMKVTVYPLPIVSFPRQVSTCFGTPVQIGNVAANGPAPITYSWSPATGLSSPDSAKPMANPPTSTLYRLLVTNANGCQSADSVLVTINSLPIIHTTAATSTCKGNPVSIGVVITSPATKPTFAWTPTRSLNDPTIQFPLATPDTTTRYYVTLTDQNGCQARDSVLVTVHPMPAVNAGPNVSSSACAPVQIGQPGSGGTPPYYYTWTPAFGLSAANIAQPMASPDGTVLYTETVTDASGCSASSNVIVTGHPWPQVDLKGPNSICPNSLGSYTVSDPNTDKITWSLLNGGAIQSGQGTNSVSVQWTKAGSWTLSVHVVSPEGCAKDTNITVLVDATLHPAISSIGNVSLCPGDSLILRAPRGYKSYKWSNGGAGDSIVIRSAGTYKVAVTDLGGCQGTSDSAVVSVSPQFAPRIIRNEPDTLCYGEVDTLYLNNVSSVSWYPDSSHAKTLVVSKSGVYYADVWQGNCSGRSDSVRISILPPLQIHTSPSDSQTICEGGSVSLTADSGFASYRWSPGNETTRSIAVSKAGTYTVQGSDSRECIGQSQPVVVRVIPQPVASIVPSPLVEFCAGSDSTLVALPSSGVSYQWYDSIGTMIGSAQRLRVSVPGVYKVLVTSSGGCSSIAFDTVRLFAPAVPVISPDTHVILCTGESVVLKAPKGLRGYTWMPGGASADTLVATEAGEYSVTVVDEHGCTATSPPVTIEIRDLTVAIQPSPYVPLCANDSLVLHATKGLASYQWSTGRSGDNLDSLIIKQPGVYSVVGTSVQGCQATSQPVTVRSIASLMRIVADKDSAFAGDSVEYSVYVRDPLFVLPDSLMRIRIRMNTDMLTPSEILTEGTLLQSATSATDTSTGDAASFFFGMTRVLPTPIDTGMPLFRFHAIVHLTNASRSRIAIDSFVLRSSNIALSLCDVVDAQFTVRAQCGQNLLIEQMAGAQILIDRISPNPVSNELTISFIKPGMSPIRYEIVDVLGRIATSGETSESKLFLSARDLPEGTLLFRATSNGFVQTRRFVVRR